ncbi:MAG: pyridoxal phosphate-dependent aminotransferase [Clostridiales bacterium]|uniref:pyridoxal phosphate-dependent aminotransferase n=1 Tax=Hornefia butyriciproducens TaxID=2652293 RepID=UPI0029F95D2D|nr:pyridoxal phosphate-dependent aminotransferase [Hornefia butyriciproducens]MCI7412216.1 pyridoxal phosphate-dependent aminotransferase [Clostridiales bacterium]MCI7680219.1 pyridoxal phosphate-dependent aminotransferase [Clostridiales bacterium]MDD7019373.1 pyridoxal phosphate-dependent aminotransferase [Hornefia butyriciproducens]MDY5424319.1 pyridoxal phosphate-dependent aminotransferase [Hornefia butyriciproducens]MDY5463824.1 pyridoxal phosphate-dependent aminotransferase [Hornefia buty
MRHKFIAKRYWKDISTPMGKVDELAKNYNDVINLSLGDPDWTTNKIIIDGAYKDALAGHTKYTEFRGDPELRTEIRKYYKESFNLDLKDEEIFVTASGCLAMYLIMEAILDDGDEVILQAPYFTPYPQQVELARGVPVELPTYEKEDFQIDIDRLESLINERTKALVINTPSNPTGNCLTVDTMKKIADIAERYDLIVISDDIYTAFSYQHPFVPFVSIGNMKSRTCVINSFSKDFTMTGWRIGNIIAPDYIVKTLQSINENVVFTAPSVSQRAAIHALRNRNVIQPPMIEEYRKRVFYAAERINQIPGMHVITPPKGTFYLFINIRETGMDSVEVSNVILQEAHVLTIPGISFGMCGEGYLRIACTVDVDLLKEAFDRIEGVSIFR